MDCLLSTQLPQTPLTVSTVVIQYEDSHIKGEYTWASDFEGETAPAEPAVTPAASSRPAPVVAANAHPLYYRSEDFPVLPGGRAQEATPCARYARTEQKRGVWSNYKASATQKASDTNAYNAVPPPASYDSPPVSASMSFVQKPAVSSKGQTMQAPVNSTLDEPSAHRITSSERVVDPDHPDYNPVVFHNAILERYVCPYKICR